MKSKSWRDVLKVHPAADLFPLMPPDDLKALGEDIKQNGLGVPVVLWQATKDAPLLLLDGRNRIDAMEAAGLPVLNQDSRKLHCRVHSSLVCGGDPFELVLSFNIHRRHLTPEQKRDLIAKVLKAKPGKSNRQIAEQVKADHKTVGAVRSKLEARGEIPHVEMVIDTKGREQPTRKEKQQAKAERRAAREIELARKITALPTKKYGVIYADPPWRFEPWSRETGLNHAADSHYPTMLTEDIKALPVPAVDDCAIFLWSTVPMLPEALAVMAAWGFTYKSLLVWHKIAVAPDTGRATP